MKLHTEPQSSVGKILKKSFCFPFCAQVSHITNAVGLILVYTSNNNDRGPFDDDTYQMFNGLIKYFSVVIIFSL